MERGTVIGRRFEVDGLARSGGMGAVFRARDRETGAWIALKIAHPEAMQHAERFAREATVLAELRHPGIVKYIAHGRTEQGEMYLAMEWLEGEDLAQRLSRAGLALDESVALITRVADTLSAAHRTGLVHRDLKPSNLFLPGGDIAGAKVLDFGIVRVSSEHDRSTQTGMVLGTIGYMAPEQARGSHELDARADVFALGCVLFECVTGRPAFAGRDALAVQAKILLEEAPRVEEFRDDVPFSLCELIARMLAKDPARRPDDAAAVVRELSGITRGEVTRRRSERPGGLTAGEQRLLCVVLLSATRPQPLDTVDAPTLASDTHGGSVFAMREAARAHGGRLEALANGSVVVTLEGTHAATDQAARAARCALSLRAIAPGVPIALATGRGDASSRRPVGEVINRAVDVLRLAEARALHRRGPPPSDRPLSNRRGVVEASLVDVPIEMDELTSGLLDARFEVRLERGARQLLGVRDTPLGARTLLGRATPFVGRTRELGMLEVIFEECVAEGIAQAVVLEGPPGIGKTRLSLELAQRLSTRDDPVEVWIARGDPMSAGAPFGMITQIVRRALGIQTGDPVAVQQARLRARLARLADPRALERWIDFLGELIDVPAQGDPSLQLRAARAEAILMGDQMRRAFEEWLAAECRARPVVLVVEDLHWGDLPSVQFIDGALRQTDGGALMVLALARPEVHSLFPALWSDRKVTRMSLGELTRRASERLVRHVLGEDTDPSMVARLVDHAAGNAFYLEEVIRAAAEHTGQELPTTVLAMVQARLESLPAESRRVLRAASVFGQVFWRAGVRALLRDVTDAEVFMLLEDLAHRELIGRRANGDARIMAAEGEWAFRHALIREAASGMLVDRDRAVGHLLAAEWLEKNIDATKVPATVLAEHFERGGAPERASRWFFVAAEEALAGNDFAAVIARAERGIACGQRLDTLGPLRLLQAEGHRWRGELEAAERYALDALNALSPDDVRWYSAAGELAVASSLRGANERLVEVAEVLRAVPLRPELLGAQLIAWARTATWLVLLGFTELGDALCARIDEGSPLLDGPDPAVTARVHYTRATHALVHGDLGACLRLSELAADDFEQCGILRSLNVQRRNVGIAHVQLGNYAEAERVLRALRTEVERMDIGTVLAEIEHWLGVALARRGNVAEARGCAVRAVEHAVRHGARWIEGRARASLASILLSLGATADAEAEARRAIEVSANTPAARALALAALAAVRFDLGFPDETLALTNEALTLLATAGGIEEGEALIRYLNAEALRATGAHDKARAAMVEARDRLLERASRIGDEGLRRGMLERVPIHARTLQLDGSLPPPPRP